MPRISPVRLVVRAGMDDGDDTQGHSADRELEVSRLRMETADGGEIVAEADGEDRFRIVEGPDDVAGHLFTVPTRGTAVVARRTI